MPVTATLYGSAVGEGVRTEYELIVLPRPRMQVVCLKCGRVTDIQDKAIERLVEERKYTNFEMQRFSLFIYGECRTCRRRRKKE